MNEPTITLREPYPTGYEIKESIFTLSELEEAFGDDAQNTVSQLLKLIRSQEAEIKRLSAVSQPTPATIPVAVGLITYTSADGCTRILLLQRGPTQSHPMYWTPPGGKIEPDESPRQAIVREIIEETGTDLKDHAYKSCKNTQNNNHDFYIYHFHLHSKPAVALESKFAGYGWFDINKPWPEPNDPYLNQSELVDLIRNNIKRNP